LQKGIIVKNISNLYKVETENNIFLCEARGKFKKSGITPAVGDRVQINSIDEQKGIIEEVLERSNYIKRPKIANLTQIVFVLSMSMPKPDLLLLDKQLAFAEFLRIEPIICINKVRAFEKDINPYLKNKHIKEVAIKDVVKILEVKLLQSHDVATKIFSYLDSLFRYAVYKGYCDRNILNDIKRGDIIPSKKYRHYSKITDIDNFKELVNSIYTYSGSHSVRGALKLVLHLPFRAENVCNLRWEYVDFGKKTITIPRSEMKIKDINLDDFKLPMSEEVENILRYQYEISGYQEWVFLGTNNRSPINSESPNKALKIMGFNDEANGKKITLHGFRGTCRSLLDTLDTENKFSFEAKEKLLDHHNNSKVVRAYTNKSDYLNHIMPIVEFWSEFILSLRK
jgi:integrase